MTTETRINEWFVPKFGPEKFRAFVGLLFLPYTGMCISFTVIGSLLAGEVHWDRIGAIALIYALALGVSAHAADSIGSKKSKPWGSYFSKAQLAALMVATLAVAYAIGAYYIIHYVPLLAIIAILEGFFLFAYNFEILNGMFHNNFWFAVSWGALPLLAGYVMQANSLTFLALAVATAAGIASYVEIRMSRPYKELKRNGEVQKAKTLENGLKAISLCTIALALAAIAYAIIFS